MKSETLLTKNSLNVQAHHQQTLVAQHHQLFASNTINSLIYQSYLQF